MRRNKKIRLLVIAVLVALSCSAYSILYASTNNPYRELNAEAKDSLLQKRVNAIRSDYESIGLSVVTVKNGEIVYSQNFGYNPDISDTTKKSPIKRDDLFLIASVSKTFVGTAIMQLIEKGLISLDDDASKFLGYKLRNPRYPQMPITIRMLLCHRSGLVRRSPFGSKTLYVLKDGYEEKIIKLFEDFEPGSSKSYSNIAYTILGAVIENVTGSRFDDYVEKNILRPLGISGGYDILRMDTTRFVRTYFYKNGRFIKTSPIYSKDKIPDEQYKIGYSTTALWPSGGMIISSEDLAKFMICHINEGELPNRKRILRKQSEKLLWERQSGTNIGLSFVHFAGVLPGIDLIGMSGGARGIHSYMLFEPNEKFGFVVICNGCTSKAVDGSDMNKLIIRELYNAFINCK